MAIFMQLNRKAFPLVVGVVAVAALAWGIYAWKFTNGSNAGTPSLVSASSLGNNSTESTPALMATHNTKSDTRRSSGGLVTDDGLVSDSDPPIRPDEDMSSVVHANRAPSLDNPVQMTFGSPSANDPSRSAAYELMEARSARDRGDLIAARASFSRAMIKGVSAADAESIRNDMAKMSESLVFGRTVYAQDPLAKTHIVGGGESLFGLADRYRIPPELIASINKISDPSKIASGSKLKVLHGPFRAVLHKSEYRMDLYLGDVVYVRSFRVGLGTDGSTPLGKWKIISKLSNPDWTDPKTGQYYAANDPNNPVGERWIGLQCTAGDCMGRTGFGIHGTIDPDSIGTDKSMGCVRLGSADIAALYDLLTPKYSTIEILP